MKLYYTMLLWDERNDNPIEISPDENGFNKNAITIIKNTFIKFYEKLK